MKRLLTLALVTILVVSMLTGVTVSANQLKADITEFYVAPNGNGDGSIDSPFGTMEQARDAIREAKRAGTLGSQGAVVYFREGTYTIKKGTTFYAEDSGTKEAPIVYRAYPGETPKFIGGININFDDFEKVTDEAILNKLPEGVVRNRIVALDLKDYGITEIPEQPWPGTYSYYGGVKQMHGRTAPSAGAPELLINGRTMTLARYPNDGYMTITTIYEAGTTASAWSEENKGKPYPEYIPPEDRTSWEPMELGFPDERVAAWTDAKYALLSGWFYWSWADQTVPIDKIDTEKNSIKTKYPSEFGAKEGQSCYVFNLIEEVDMPGEYYVDRDTCMMYLYPPREDINEVLYTVLADTMVVGNKAEYITFKGFDMSAMRSSAFYLKDCVGVEIADCEISYGINFVVKISGGSDCKVYDCHVFSNDRGISVSGGDRNTLTPAGHIIENNHIEKNETKKLTYSPGIEFQGVGIKVSNNELNNAKHLLVQWGGNNHVFEYNELYDACLDTDDMGAIYSGRNLTFRGNELRYNYFHDVGGAGARGLEGCHAVYLDDFFSAAKVYGNICDKVTGSNVFTSGSDNEVYNNIFMNGQAEAIASTRVFDPTATKDNGFISIYENQLTAVDWQGETWQKAYPELKNLKDKDGNFIIGSNIKLTNNLLYNIKDVKMAEEIKALNGVVEGNYTTETTTDFVDYEGGDFTLKEDAAVFEQIEGFEPVPFNKMGRYDEKAFERVEDAFVYCAYSPYAVVKGNVEKKDRIAATIIDGEVYIPLRVATEAVNGTVAYNEKTDAVSFGNETITLEFANSNSTVTNVNGKELAMKKKIVNINDTNYISITDLAELFGKKAVLYGNIVVMSDTENLINKENEQGLLRFLETQISVY